MTYEFSTVAKTVDKPLLTANEKAHCEQIMQQPKVTQKQLAEYLGLTERGVRYLTDKLQKQRVLQRQGGKKSGVWAIVDPAGAGRTGE
jgi:ATP-dependent DNA helicase RecG